MRFGAQDIVFTGTTNYLDRTTPPSVVADGMTLLSKGPGRVYHLV